MTLAQATAQLRIAHPDRLAGRGATALIEGPNGEGLAFVTHTWRITTDTCHRLALVCHLIDQEAEEVIEGILSSTVARVAA